MVLLVLGVLLWWGAHLFKRVAPGMRAGLGDAGKGYVAAALALSVVLMVWGFRQADYIQIYSPLRGMGHLNNLLMLIAVFMFGVGGTKGTLYTRLRHPMLTGMVLWAVAHLLVNGDLASLILFGGLGVWAVVQMIAINRAGPWVRPAAGRGVKGDLMNAAGTLVLYAAIAGVHLYFGFNPFLGTYG